MNMKDIDFDKWERRIGTQIMKLNISNYESQYPRRGNLCDTKSLSKSKVLCGDKIELYIRLKY